MRTETQHEQPRPDGADALILDLPARRDGATDASEHVKGGTDWSGFNRCSTPPNRRRP